MAAKHDTATNARPAGPAAHLAAAQADAQRFVGEGPVVLWRPSSTRRRAVAAVAVALLLAAAAWWWWPAGASVEATAANPAAVSPGPQGTAPSSVPPPDAAAAVAPGEVADEAASPLCDRAGCAGLATLPTPSTPPTIAGEAADPDAWALNPEPGPSASPPSFTGFSNIPEVPNENDATPADETSPQQEVGELAQE